MMLLTDITLEPGPVSSLGGGHHYHAHFTGEETEPREVRGRGSIQPAASPSIAGSSSLLAPPAPRLKHHFHSGAVPIAPAPLHLLFPKHGLHFLDSSSWQALIIKKALASGPSGIAPITISVLRKTGNLHPCVTKAMARLGNSTPRLAKSPGGCNWVTLGPGRRPLSGLSLLLKDGEPRGA